MKIDLKETKKALQRSEAILDRIITHPNEDSISGSPALKSTKHTVKLPDPHFFSGENKDIDYDNWLIQVKNKLRGNATSYPTEELKIIYITSRLSGNALALVSPRLDINGYLPYTTIGQLYDHLNKLFGDPNKRKNAKQSFNKLIMKKDQTFQDFYALFLRYAADGNIKSNNLKDEIYDKLTWNLQQFVDQYYNDPAVDTDQFATLCTTHDQQIRNRLEKRN